MPFCARISATCFGAFQSLRSRVVSGGGFGGPVSASENPVPGGQGSTDIRFVSGASNSAVLATVVVCSGRALLLRIQAKRFELLTPFRWKFAQPLDVNASRQSALDSSADQLGSKEGKRDGHVDMTDAASLSQCNLLDVSDRP